MTQLFPDMQHKQTCTQRCTQHTPNTRARSPGVALFCMSRGHITFNNKKESHKHAQLMQCLFPRRVLSALVFQREMELLGFRLRVCFLFHFLHVPKHLFEPCRDPVPFICTCAEKVKAAANRSNIHLRERRPRRT